MGGGGALLLLVATLWLGAMAALQCAQRREISPCSCHNGDGGLMLICERVGSYASIAAAIQGRFPQGTQAALAVTHSDLRDLGLPTIANLGLTVHNLKLNYDNISELEETAFIGLEAAEYLSLADNELSSVPRHVLQHTPNIITLDVGRNQIKVLSAPDLKDLPRVQFLMMAGNGIASIDRNSLPRDLKHLHLGINALTTLNGTLRHLYNLEWLLIHSNKLTSIDNEFPMQNSKMKMIHAANNHLESLPRELRNMPLVDSLYFHHNNIKSLNGALQKATRLDMLNISFNKLKHLSADDFADASNLAKLDMGHNQLQTLNGSLRNLSLLKQLNLSHNELMEFSLQEIRGVKNLEFFDLSYNKISHLSGYLGNPFDVETRVLEIRLNNNKLRNLGGALIGIGGLLKLNLSHNLLETLSRHDLIGLTQLKVLDVSHNHIKALEKTSQTYLPSLEELYASFNKISSLDRDFDGIPQLCNADLSYNNIESISHELVTKTWCIIHGVMGSLKIHLHDNPALCDENYPRFSTYIHEKFKVRLYGECMHRKQPIASSTTTVPSLLLNEIMPLSNGLSITTLDEPDHLKTGVLGIGSKYVRQLPTINRELNVYPSMTVPPISYTTTQPPQEVPRQSSFILAPEPPPKII